MGLDITAYSHLSAIPPESHNTGGGFCTYDPEYNEDNPGGWEAYLRAMHIQVYAYTPFLHSLNFQPQDYGLTSYLLRPHEDMLVGPCLLQTEDTVEHRFRAGSYGGYNQWRTYLSQIFNSEQDPARPFYELIYFADNEGTITAGAARNLLADFEVYGTEYRTRLRELLEDKPSVSHTMHTSSGTTTHYAPTDEAWKHHNQVFDSFWEAARLASQGGVIDFH